MPDFQFYFEWEESPRVHAPELNATWARLEIRVNGEAITKVEAKRTQSVRNGIYIPLFPIAEWIVANWWFLWDEWRGSARDSRHSLLAAREGFVLPDLSFLPTETRMEMTWRSSSPASSSSDVLFLSGGTAIVSKTLVRDEFRRLVEAVIERLSGRQVQHSYLVSEWQAIVEAERDPEQREFCEKAARLGCDPFDVSDDVAAQIEHLGVLLPEPVIEDFCDAIPLTQLTFGALAVKIFIDSASSIGAEEGRWREFREKLRWQSEEAPWRDGYNEARALRAYLGTSGPIGMDIDTFLAREFGSLEIRDVDVPSRIDAISALTQTEAPLLGFSSRLRGESRRFILCRALSDHLASGLPSLVTRGSTEHQQRNRAFAAEFLAPAESLKQRIGGDRIGEEDVEELAQEFQVSELVIRHQIQNHKLAWLSA